ncbi:hypothetical protein [Legionella lansingensis]|uniref:hypothetical protein n=1 Tax=Legionella lansingensis TaxID=45067 RepID=UPI000ACA5071|nr:hypothetical protein [Legionella lansingensis]
MIVVNPAISPNSKNTCTAGIISSATVKQAEEITDFLKSQKELQPYPIQVINE